MKPPCPHCKTNKQVTTVGLVGDMFHCGRCGGTFDIDPAEGGDYCTDPSKRMERQEANKPKFNKRYR